MTDPKNPAPPKPNQLPRPQPGAEAPIRKDGGFVSNPPGEYGIPKPPPKR